MIRTFDHTPDSPENKRTLVMSYKSDLEASEYSLEKYECPILNQGEYGACGGHGSSMGLYIRYNFLGQPLGWIPSQAEIYAASRAVTRAKFEAGLLNPLDDTGVQPADMMKAISTIGICPMQKPFTEDGRRSDVDADTVDKELSLELIEASGRKVPVGEYRLDPNSGTFVDDLCIQITKGIPVGLGIWVDEAFQNYSGVDPLSAVDMTPKDGSGWHWVCAVGFRTDNKFGRVIKIANSWGETWGINGHFEVTADRLIKSTSDAYPFAIGSV